MAEQFTRIQKGSYKNASKFNKVNNTKIRLETAALRVGIT